MSEVQQLQAPVTSNEAPDQQQNGISPNSIAETTASLTIEQPPAPVGLPPALPTTTPTTNPEAYPAAPALPYAGINPYAAYNPLANPLTNPLAFGAPPYPVVPPLPGTVNPFYAYPYAAYNYYQPPAAAAFLPQVTPAVTPAAPTKAKTEDKTKNKNKKNKNKNQPQQQQQQEQEVEDEEEDDDPTIDRGMKKGTKANNVLPFWGNEKTMNLNPLILTNVQNSPYFKNDLYQLKSYHEVIDEIYYQVKHLEPWERGSRKVGGNTGMCNSVRGVGSGGVVSTPFCILYKLYTLKLTRKQLNGLLKHKDSPYIRALGFLYVRYTQPPSDFWKWFEPYLEDEEEIEVKAGVTMTIGELCRYMISKMDWYSTLFPRMPIPVQKELERQLQEYDRNKKKSKTAHLEDGELEDEYDGRKSSRDYKGSRNLKRSRSRSRSKDDKYRDRWDDRRNEKHRRSRSRSRDRRRSRSRERHADRSKERHRYR